MTNDARTEEFIETARLFQRYIDNAHLPVIETGPLKGLLEGTDPDPKKFVISAGNDLGARGDGSHDHFISTEIYGLLDGTGLRWSEGSPLSNVVGLGEPNLVAFAPDSVTAENLSKLNKKIEDLMAMDAKFLGIKKLAYQYTGLALPAPESPSHTHFHFGDISQNARDTLYPILREAHISTVVGIKPFMLDKATVTQDKLNALEVMLQREITAMQEASASTDTSHADRVAAENRGTGHAKG